MLAAPMLASTAGASSTVDLTGIAVGGGPLQPGFMPQRTVYTVDVDVSVATTQVTAISSPEAALTATVNGAPFAINSGAPSNVPLNPGCNLLAITTHVLSDTKTYTVIVHRGAGGTSNDGNLGGLSLTAGPLQPAFNPATTGYSVNVDSSVSSTRVTAASADPCAAMELIVNGATTTSLVSGVAGPPAAINVGANTIAVRVTASDGVTTKTYTVTVNVTAPAPPVIPSPPPEQSPAAPSLQPSAASAAPDSVPAATPPLADSAATAAFAPRPAVPQLGDYHDLGLLGLSGLIQEVQVGAGNDVTVSTSAITARVTSLRSPVVALVARFTSNPAPVPLAGVSFADLRVVGASDDAVAKVVFHLPPGMQSAKQLVYFDGTQWRDVGAELITRPSEGSITVMLDGASQPRITELTGTFFAVVPRQPAPLLGPAVKPHQVRPAVQRLGDEGFPLLVVLLGLSPVCAVAVASTVAWRSRPAG
jgi:hypothetical protein